MGSLVTDLKLTHNSLLFFGNNFDVEDCCCDTQPIYVLNSKLNMRFIFEQRIHHEIINVLTSRYHMLVLTHMLALFVSYHMDSPLNSGKVYSTAHVYRGRGSLSSPNLKF